MTLSDRACRNLAVALIFAVSGSGCGSWFYMGQHPSVSYSGGEDHMPEESRRLVNSLRIVADPSKPVLRIGGDYGVPTTSTGEGAAEGMAAGAAATGEMIAEDPRAIVLAPVVLPAAVIFGAAAGATAAKIEQELAEFREGLADELVAAGDAPVPGEALTEQLVQLVTTTTEIGVAEENVDAELEVVIEEIYIYTQDEDALITTIAQATLRSAADQSTIYTKTANYSERNKLRKWANDDRAAWDGYTRRAREFLAADIVADLFETVHLRHVLRPLATDSFSGGWNGRFKDKSATLAWELFLLGGDPYIANVDEEDIQFDLRVLDEGRIIYEARNIRGNEHAVTEPLPECRTLKWSVRPLFRLDGRPRAGEWMHFRSGFDKVWNNQGVQPYSETAEYWRYFADVKSRCTS